MMAFFKNRYSKWAVLAISLTLMVGCSKATTPSKSNTTNVQNENEVKVPNSSTTKPIVKDSSSTSGDNATNTDPALVNSQRIVMSNILKLAKQGKVINCEFPANTTIIEDVNEKWGQPDKTDWVAAAKGTYATYLKKNVVFGFNKGSQIFEVRTLDKSLNKISLSTIKRYFGTPAYDVKTKTEEIIGYTAGKDFKILFVFLKSSANGTNQFMNHYSVLYPRGTVNNMSDDPGRQW